MDKKLFAELLASLKEAKAIRECRAKPGPVTRYKALNPRAIRDKSGLSQERFAALMGVKLATYRNWEQGRRVPHGPAQVLLMVADYDPTIIRKAIRAQREKPVDEAVPATASPSAVSLPVPFDHRRPQELAVKEAPAAYHGRKQTAARRKTASEGGATRRTARRPSPKPA